MEIVYSGKEVKKLLNEAIPGYKPVIGGGSTEKNKEINGKSNKESMKNTSKLSLKQDFKPKVDVDKQSSEFGNNKNMLNLQFDEDPGKEYKERVKKQVTGENSEFGNKPNEGDDNKSNKAFYDLAQKAVKDVVDKKQKLSNSGLTGKNLPVDKKKTAFNENKTMRLNFKNTTFLNNKHLFSLIPEDYKKEGSQFIMKDKEGNEYLIEWKQNEQTNISEGIIKSYTNKKKISEEFNRIKQLYGYKSENQSGKLTNSDRVEENNIVFKSVKKLKDLSEI